MKDKKQIAIEARLFLANENNWTRNSWNTDGRTCLGGAVTQKVAPAHTCCGPNCREQFEVLKLITDEISNRIPVWGTLSDKGWGYQYEDYTPDRYIRISDMIAIFNDNYAYHKDIVDILDAVVLRLHDGKVPQELEEVVEVPQPIAA
jgi:hypothetical protein